MHGRARELAFGHDAGALEHADDAAHGAPRLLALGAYDDLGDLGADRARRALVVPRVGQERVESPALVAVVPGLDRAYPPDRHHLT